MVVRNHAAMQAMFASVRSFDALRAARETLFAARKTR